MSAVHPGDDGGSQDIPLAVHRVQVLQHVWHIGERRMFGLLAPQSHTCTHISYSLVYGIGVKPDPLRAMWVQVVIPTEQKAHLISPV